MVSKQQALTTLKRFKSEAGLEYGIISMGLFGSLARDQATDSSDVDVVVETEEVDAFQIVHMKEKLEELLNTPVDIVRKRNRRTRFSIIHSIDDFLESTDGLEKLAICETHIPPLHQTIKNIITDLKNKN